ncbi:MAG: hypothetical protein HZB76_00865 [Chlamydiae bacterium]|nr:hypothetical protein [Chlamydiota bacterium]
MPINELALIVRCRHDPTNHFTSPLSNYAIEKITRRFKETAIRYFSTKDELMAIFSEFKDREITLLLFQAHGNSKRGALYLSKKEFLYPVFFKTMNLANVKTTILHCCSLAASFGVVLSKKTGRQVWASRELIYQIRLYFSPTEGLKVFFSASNNFAENPYNLLAIKNNTVCLEECNIAESFDQLKKNALALVKNNKITEAIELLSKIRSVILSYAWSQKLSDVEIHNELDFLYDNIYLPIFESLKNKEDFTELRHLLFDQISLSCAFENKNFKTEYLKKMQKELLKLAEMLFSRNKLDLIYQIFYGPLDFLHPSSSEAFMQDIISGYISINELEKGGELTLKYIKDPMLKDQFLIQIINSKLADPNASLEKMVEYIDNVNDLKQKEDCLIKITQRFIERKEHKLALKCIQKMQDLALKEKNLFLLATSWVKTENFLEVLQIVDLFKSAITRDKVLFQIAIKLIYEDKISEAKNLMSQLTFSLFKDQLRMLILERIPLSTFIGKIKKPRANISDASLIEFHLSQVGSIKKMERKKFIEMIGSEERAIEHIAHNILVDLERGNISTIRYDHLIPDGRREEVLQRVYQRLPQFLKECKEKGQPVSINAIFAASSEEYNALYKLLRDYIDPKSLDFMKMLKKAIKYKKDEIIDLILKNFQNRIINQQIRYKGKGFDEIFEYCMKCQNISALEQLIKIPDSTTDWELLFDHSFQKFGLDKEFLQKVWKLIFKKDEASLDKYLKKFGPILFARDLTKEMPLIGVIAWDLTKGLSLSSMGITFTAHIKMPDELDIKMQRVFSECVLGRRSSEIDSDCQILPERKKPEVQMQFDEDLYG